MDVGNTNREIFNASVSSSNKDPLSLDKLDLSPYDQRMMELRLRLIRQYGKQKTVLDLCCGTGSYLLPYLTLFVSAIGVDFSENLLNVLRQKLKGQIPGNLLPILGDARQIPVQSNTIDFIYSFCSLYYIPGVREAIQEMSRVLRQGGIAVFELGNYWSLNTYVCNWAHRTRGIAKPFHISYPEMLHSIQSSGLTILEERVFQLLPMWGGPLWLFPLVTSMWKMLLGVRVGDRMLDEYISGFGPLKYLAFRHLFVCKKG